MLFLKLLLLAYLLSAVLAAVMVFAAVRNKGFRLIFIGFGILMPILLPYAIVNSLFAPKKIPCFQEEIASVEDDIETERVRIFGGERICPSFGKRWELMYEAYVERLAIKAVRASEKITSIARSFRPTSLAS